MITSFFKPKRDLADNNGNSANDNNDSKKQKTNHCKNNSKSIEVSRLISNLEDSAPSSPNSISWKAALDKHLSSAAFRRHASFVESERKKYTIFPPEKDILSALNLSPLQQVRLVIVGQDPYHGPHQAHGLCFSVRNNVKTPPSLRNIYKELMTDSKITNFNAMPIHGNLERWAKQGVLMINNVLTVRKGEPNSHKKRGWEEFTDEIIRAVERRIQTERDCDDNKKGVVFLLWGKPATLKAETAMTFSSRHTIICTSHPSPLGATKTTSPFLGSNCFSRANEALRDMGYDAIDWRVDGKLP